MNITIDIESTVSAAISAALNPDVLAGKITDLVGKSVDNVLADQFRPYGEFGKVVAAAVKSVIPHAVSIDGAARFDHALKAAVERRLAAYNEERIGQALGPMLDGLLEMPPAEIKLSKLVADAREAWADNHRRDGDDRMSVVVEEPAYGSRWIYMDPRSGRDKYACQMRIGVSDDGKIFGLKIEGQEVGKTLFAGDFYAFERDLFALYTRGSKLIVDVSDFDEDDLYYPEGSDD